MKWYSGDIAQAIVFSKSKGAVFVVYIQGNDGQSEKITSLIENGELGSKLEQDHFVAIKLEAGSVPHQQFSEIYKNPSIPSLYFIGKNGAPLGIITGNDDLDTIPKRIDEILVKAGLRHSRPADPSQSLIQNEQSDESSNVSENVACSVVTNEPSSTSENSDSVENIQKEEDNELSAEEKLRRAKELLEKKREQKLMEEKENERLKEIERRKTGQGVHQLKKWQEEQEMKQLKEDRDREKRENQAARERVLAQIAQDRAERMARNQSHSPPEQHSPVPASPPAVSGASNSNVTRLQFKLPDGSSNTQEFAVSDSLEFVVSYIKSNLKLPFNKFILATTFPRRDFSNNDYSQSLLDLQLVPNAVILVLPLNSGSVSTNPGGSFTALIWSLFAPIWNMLGFVRNFIFGTNPNVGGNKRPSDNAAEPRDDPKRRIRDSTVVKRQGNIHRLTDRKDSDDENNTWNGNSTQQM